VPDHAEDVAGAFAWTHKHVARYGGRPEKLERSERRYKGEEKVVKPDAMTSG